MGFKINNKLILVGLLVTFTSAFSQKKPKIKGDRNVVEINTILSNDFHSISVEDDLEVSLYVATTPSYTVEADENISKIINFRVKDSVLRVFTDYNIQSKKKLDIKLTVNSITGIQLSENAKITGKSKIEADSITISARDGSKFDLDISAEKLTASLADNASGSLSAQIASNSHYALADRADLTLYTSTKTIKAMLVDNASITVEGNCEQALYTIIDNSKIKAEKFPTFRTNLTTSGKSEAIIHTTEFLELYAKDKSSIYLYGEPEIDVKGLKGEVSIKKRI